MGTIQARLLAQLLPRELVRLAAVTDDPELREAAAAELWEEVRQLNAVLRLVRGAVCDG